ncbi:copper resistance CopC family protein [Puerhibacterium puerhi]|uniref:copper resistance CopC family protein n=1 Tax=Puerhibacterium puerhi TaxID=2692623 RepID=UPI001358334D|nr:copper resistance CopC family protein [Puerhibacterium puerhi]
MTALRTLRAGARRAAVVAVAAALAAPGLLTLAAAPASAHNVLVGTNPPADQTLAEPLDQVTLTFDDVVLDLGGGGGEGGGGTALDVTGPDGTHHATACPSVVDTTVSAPVALGEAGTYTVAYRVVSADGHPISGRYQFDYAPPEGTPATAGTAAAACGASDGAASDDGSAGRSAGDAGGASDAGTAAPETGTDAGTADTGTAATVTGTTWDVSPGAAIGIAAGTAVVGAAAVLVALRLARRR